ncbi:MAG: efflux RND transporter permease subunit, partial [Pseudomonadota bacterium]
VPLAVATGASAASQNAIGTGVLGGMISATVFAVFFVPAFFVFVMRLFDRSAREELRKLAQQPEEAKPAAAASVEA